MLLRPRAGRVLATAALTLLAVLTTGVPANAAEKAIWGPTTLPDGASAFGLYSDLGIDTLQFSVSWPDVAPIRPATPTDPADPAYRWPPEIAAAAAEAAGRGIRLALLVSGTPSWANGGRSPIWVPDDPRDFGDFLTAAARRYPAVRRWMIWGEPNRDDRFQPNAENDPAGPRAYARLLDAAYAALKRRSAYPDPRQRERASNKVIGGMTWTSGTVKPPDFVRFMRLPNGKPPRLDWFGHNPFPFRFPNLADSPLPGGFRDISDLDSFGREIGRTYRRRVPLWLSEYTIQSDRGSAQFATFVTRAAQARYVAAGFRIADDMGGAVAGFGWFSLLDEPLADNSANWGLLTHAGERKPAFAAMQRAPSERLRPAVRVVATVARATLRGRGLRVTVTPRAAGRGTVELRKGTRLRVRVRVSGFPGRARAVRLRLRSPVGPGRYTVNVRVDGGSTVSRTVRVR